MSDIARMDRIETRMLAVEAEANKLHGVLVGIDSQGGVIHRLAEVAAQGHKVASAMAAFQGEHQLMQENIQALVEAMKR